ncbi:MAG TPA: bifunctional oligoribonuclease/PAP phosphatase NrnA, partial [Acholeplasmataceae bacterium]|nr:bifunctional oligoribonuclease/PAP phosphatase NrnA [Acholeplasmataceae bacterium]
MRKIVSKFEEYGTIIIHRHSRPDGDAIGSQIGLKEALQATWPGKRVFAVGDENGKFSFIGGMDEVRDEDYKGALVVVLDTAEESLISDGRYGQGEFLVKIDHHFSGSSFGDLEYVDTSYESCAGLIADFIFENGLQLTPKGARALFAGIVTDSGRFRYDSVTPKTFETVAKLLKYGFSMMEVYNNLYLEDLELVKLRAEFVTKFRLTENNVAYIMTTAAEVKDYGIDVFTASRGMVNVMSGIRGVDVWVNFTEDPGNGAVLAEIRSSKLNINEIAVKYGGG